MTNSTTRRVLVLMFAPAALSCGLAKTAQSQPGTVTHGSDRWPVDSLLSHFVRVTEGGGSATSILFRAVDSPEIPAARRDSVVAGLEKLALRGASYPVRRTAASYLMMAGMHNRERPAPGVAARIIRVYRETEDPRVRFSMLGLIHLLVERDTIARFLEELATTVTKHEWNIDYPPDEESLAIEALMLMGEHGRAALMRLHHAGTVRGSGARGLLARAAAQGFPVRDVTRFGAP